MMYGWTTKVDWRWYAGKNGRKHVFHEVDSFHCLLHPLSLSSIEYSSFVVRKSTPNKEIIICFNFERR